MESIKPGFRVSLLWFSTALISMSLYLPSLAHARTASYGILPPGAKIVPGDAGKNEFYILAKGEKPPIPIHQLAQHKPAAAILKKPHKLSLKNTKHPFAKVIQGLANKKVIAKLNHVLREKDYKKLNMQFRELLAKKEVKCLQEAINRELKGKKKNFVKLT